MMATVPCCKLCSEPFTNPRLLPCLHVFCKSCLESLQSQNEGTLTCPTCYKTSPHPPADLPRHLRIEREVAISRIQEGGEETVCGSCGESNKVEAYCEDCSSGICSDCVGMHKRLKALKNHEVVPLHPEVKLQRQTVHAFSCDFHPKETLKYYCISCRYLVCSDCLFYHKEHGWRQMDEAAEVERVELQSVLPELKKAVPSAAAAIRQISNLISDIGVDKNKCMQKINEAFAEINAAFEKKRLELLQEVENSAVGKTTQLEIQKEGLQKITAGLQLSIDGISVACREYSTAEVLAVKPTIYQASKSLLEESLSSSFCPVSNSLRVEIETSDVTEMVSTLGRVRNTPRLCPRFCTLVGINTKLPIGAAKGCKCTVLLQTRDSKGEDLKEGGADVRGRVTMGLEASDCMVRDLSNGRYEVNFDNPVEGQYQLHLTVDSEKIDDVPFVINVRDYTAIESPLITLQTDYQPTYIDISHSNVQYVTMNGGCINLYDGNKVREIACSGNNLRGIAIDEQTGVMFIASANTHQIIKASLDGEVLASVGTHGLGKLEFDWPMGLCLSPEGFLLVAGNGNSRIQVLGSDLSFIRSIPCQSSIRGIAVDSTGNVHAAANGIIEVFNIHGDKLMEYGKGVLNRTGDVTFLQSTSSYSFVTNYKKSGMKFIDGKVLIFDWSKDILLHSLSAGKNPLGIKVDQEGKLVVCCWRDKQILSF